MLIRCDNLFHAFFITQSNYCFIPSIVSWLLELHLLYALSQFVQIGQGLYAINACYLPVSDETTKLDIIVFQLQREQERIDTSKFRTQMPQFINASFYIEELEDGLERTKRIIQLARDNLTLSTHLKN